MDVSMTKSGWVEGGLGLVKGGGGVFQVGTGEWDKLNF